MASHVRNEWIILRSVLSTVPAQFIKKGCALLPWKPFIAKRALSEVFAEKCQQSFILYYFQLSILIFIHNQLRHKQFFLFEFLFRKSLKFPLVDSSRLAFVYTIYTNSIHNIIVEKSLETSDFKSLNINNRIWQRSNVKTSFLNSALNILQCKLLTCHT